MTHYGRRQGIRNKIYLERNEKQVKFLIGTFFFWQNQPQLFCSNARNIVGFGFRTGQYLAKSDRARQLASAKLKASESLLSSIFRAFMCGHTDMYYTTPADVGCILDFFLLFNPCHLSLFVLKYERKEGEGRRKLLKWTLEKVRTWSQQSEYNLPLIFCAWPQEKNFNSLSLSSLICEDGDTDSPHCAIMNFNKVVHVRIHY